MNESEFTFDKIAKAKIENAWLRVSDALGVYVEVNGMWKERVEKAERKLAQCHVCQQDAERLTRELAETRKDTVRLDWYIKFIMEPIGGIAGYGDIRKAIDVTMESENSHE